MNGHSSLDFSGFRVDNKNRRFVFRQTLRKYSYSNLRSLYAKAQRHFFTCATPTARPREQGKAGLAPQGGQPGSYRQRPGTVRVFRHKGRHGRKKGLL